MKKINIHFIGECIIIALMLVIIGMLLRDEDKFDRNTIVAETSLQEQDTDVHQTVDSDNVIVEAMETTEKEDLFETGVVENVKSRIEVESVKENVKDVVSTELTGKSIVVFGDSIWNDGRGEDGISEHIMTLTGSTVYNCAIGGTTAARLGERPESLYEWNSQSFVGMVHVANGQISADKLLADTEACEVIKQVDFSTVDYILVAYGLNDFFSDISVYPETYYDGDSYVGALRKGIELLKNSYPNAEIVLLTPTYTELLEEEKEYRIGDYVEAMRGVAEEYDLQLADMFHNMGENAASRLEQLDDGVHLSEEGRKVYAEGVVWYLTEIEKTKKQTR